MIHKWFIDEVRISLSEAINNENYWRGYITSNKLRILLGIYVAHIATPTENHMPSDDYENINNTKCPHRLSTDSIYMMHQAYQITSRDEIQLSKK
jgi:hypothetical protein